MTPLIDAVNALLTLLDEPPDEAGFLFEDVAADPRAYCLAVQALREAVRAEEDDIERAADIAACRA
jgi:hypothetical protein